MKRNLLITILFASIFLFWSPTEVMAVPTNRFNCVWSGSTIPGFCEVDAASAANCAPGKIPNPSVCLSPLSSGTCNSTTGACIDPAPTPTPNPGGTMTCEWTVPFGPCKTAPGGDNCKSGYSFNCSGIDVQDFCGLGPLPCLSSPTPASGAYDPRCGPDSDRNSAVRTALGCLPTSPQAFVDIAIPWAIGLGSGVAFLLGLYGVLMIVISAGNPEKMQAGRELITSAITGLLIIVFAVFILKVVGVDILKLFFWKEQQVWQ